LFLFLRLDVPGQNYTWRGEECCTQGRESFVEKCAGEWGNSDFGLAFLFSRPPAAYWMRARLAPTLGSERLLGGTPLLFPFGKM